MLGLFDAQLEPKRLRQLFTYPTSVNGPEKVISRRAARPRRASAALSAKSCWDWKNLPALSGAF